VAVVQYTFTHKQYTEQHYIHEVKFQHEAHLTVICQWVDFALRNSLMFNFALEATVQELSISGDVLQER
jgi:hypothetical protein